MNITEVQQALRHLRLGGMAQTVETRLLQAQAERMAPLDLISALILDEQTRRKDRLLARRVDAARFRDSGKTLENFDLEFNKKMDRRLIFDLATAQFINKHEDVLFLGPPGTGKSHLAQAIGRSAIINATASCTGRRTFSSKRSLTLRWMARANSTCRCSVTWRC